MLRTFFKKIFPWVVVVLVFAYLFHECPPSEVRKALNLIDIPYFCLVAVAYFVLMYFLDTFVISRILNHFGHESSFKEALPARGLTYLLMVINYAASQLAFALYQNRKHGLPKSEMFGIFGIIVVLDLCILTMLTFITTFFTTWPPESFGGMNVAHFVRAFTLVGVIIFILNFLFWRGTFGKIEFLEKLRTKDFFSVLSRAGLKDYLAVGLWRLPVHIFIMFGMFIAIKPFNASIPFINILQNIPLVFFIGALPISPGGLGTSNVAMVELFKPFVSSPNITAGVIKADVMLLSFSLVWLFANYLMKALTGVICLKFVSKDLFKPAKGEVEETVLPDATTIAGDL